jgi:hypothetical protein
MKKILLIASLAIGFLIASFLCYLHWGRLWTAYAEKRLPILASEFDASMQGVTTLNGTPPPAPEIIAFVTPGEPIGVLWDKYGKDYWACYIRTSVGVRGWVLCTDLKRR